MTVTVTKVGGSQGRSPGQEAVGCGLVEVTKRGCCCGGRRTNKDIVEQVNTFDVNSQAAAGAMGAVGAVDLEPWSQQVVQAPLASRDRWDEQGAGPPKYRLPRSLPCDAAIHLSPPTKTLIGMVHQSASGESRTTPDLTPLSRSRFPNCRQEH